MHFNTRNEYSSLTQLHLSIWDLNRKTFVGKVGKLKFSHRNRTQFLTLPLSHTLHLKIPDRRLESDNFSSLFFYSACLFPPPRSQHTMIGEMYNICKRREISTNCWYCDVRDEKRLESESTSSSSTFFFWNVTNEKIIHRHEFDIVGSLAPLVFLECVNKTKSWKNF